MASLALLFNPPSDSQCVTRVSENLRALCDFWLLLTNDYNESIDHEIRHAMAGIDGEVINLIKLPAEDRAHRIAEALHGRATNLALLQVGMTVECEIDFLPKNDDRMEECLHLSPGRDTGVWLPTLIPNSADHWMLDDSSHVTARQRGGGNRNNKIRMLDHNRFPRRRSPDHNEIKNLLDIYRSQENAESAMSVAEAFYKSKDYQQAADWYPAVYEGQVAIPVRWLAYYRRALCLMQQDADWPEIETELAAAFDLDPDRLEPLYYLVKHYRERGDTERACELAEVASQIGEPAAGIEFEPGIYRYQLTMEYTQCTLALGHDARCIEIVNEALRTPFVPEQGRRELASLRAIAYDRLCPVYPLSIQHRNRLLILIAFRNAGEFLIQCIESIQQQDYEDFRVILVDDASTDGALAACGKLDQCFTTIVNEQRKGALHNQLSAIEQFASEDDIVIHLDGDDWLAHENVLARINEFFNSTRCWLMYGQYETSLGSYGSCEPIVPGNDLLEQLTKMHFPMHIRAYRACVYFQLLNQDPSLTVLKNDDGKFFPASSDLALMRALIQIAGVGNTRYNEEILYIYNRSNPESHYQERDLIALQKSLAAIAAAKPPLQQVDSYLDHGEASGPAAKTKTLFIALDGTTPSLIEQWSADGRLCNLSRVLECCRETQIHSPEGFGNSVFWNALCTGLLPDETGYIFRKKWNPVTLTCDFKGAESQVSQDSFWTRLASTDAEMAIIDMPEIKIGDRINGLEISGWFPHSRQSLLKTTPPGLKKDILERFGEDPIGETDRLTPRSEQETNRDLDLLKQSVELQTTAARHYLGRGGWDFFAVGYQQLHSIGHQFWHLHDPGHRHFSKNRFEKQGDPLLQNYQVVDNAIGELLETAGQAINLVVVSGLSMQSMVSCNAILDEILWELDVHDRRQAGEPCPIERDLKNRRFFAIPHNQISGAIRINLAGREAKGIVSDGNEYDELINLLQQRLSQVIDTITGEAVVSKFISIRKRYSGSCVNELPDLLVIWKRDHPIYEVSSPYFEPIKVRVRDMTDTRSGDHSGEARLYSNVASLAGENGVINVEDIAGHLVDLITEKGGT